MSTSDDLAEAAQLAVQTLREMEGTLAEPSPEVHVMELGDSNVKVRVFGWLDQREYDYFRLRSEMNGTSRAARQR